MYLDALCLLLINLKSLTCKQFFFESIHDTHVDQCIYLSVQRENKQVTTTINGNMSALQHTITKKSEI